MTNRLLSSALLGLALVASAGCNAKIKKYATRIDAMSVTADAGMGDVRVNMGDFVAPEGAGEAGAAAVTAGNVAVDIAEGELEARLRGLLDADALARASGERLVGYMTEVGPFPADEGSRWKLFIEVNAMGIEGGVGQEASAFVTVNAEAVGPKGRRIWTDYETCRQPLGPHVDNTDVMSSAVNVGIAIGTLKGMSNAELNAIFETLAVDCGREVGESLNRVIQKGRAKAARKAD